MLLREIIFVYLLLEMLVVNYLILGALYFSASEDWSRIFCVLRVGKVLRTRKNIWGKNLV